GHVTEGVPGASRAPTDKRHWNHDEQDGQADERERRHECGPGLTGHGLPDCALSLGLGALSLELSTLSVELAVLVRQSYPLGSPRGEVLLLPDRYLSLEGVDQVCARGQRLTAV